MQTLKDLLTIIALLALILFTSCVGTKHFEGVISEVRNDTVVCATHTFKIKRGVPVPSVGTFATFTSSVRRNKINSRILKP